jgi:hypothetical protein
MKQMLRKILYVQGFYLIILGLWPIVNIDGFMIYTGQKTDIWLVRTFGAMLACEGLCFIITGILREIAFPMLILAFLNSVLLLFVDMHYNFDNVLGESYLVEALFEMIFIVWWVVVFVKLSRSSRYRYAYR